MGIENRDYYREDTWTNQWSERSQGGAWSALTWMMVITVGCFLAQIFIGESFTRMFLLQPDQVLYRGKVWQLLTYAFLHDPHNIWHIVLNMWVLYMAGRDFERRHGSAEFVAFYLFSAIVSGMAVVAWELTVGQNSPSVGASGAVSAILIVFALSNPQATIYMFGFIPMRMLTFAVVIILFDAVPMLAELFGRGNPHDRIAHSAHLGGLLMGVLYQRRQWRVMDWVPSSLLRFPSKPWRTGTSNLKVHRPDETDSSVDFDKQVDELLDKVSRQGEASLTDVERTILVEASRRAKNRRS